MDDDTLFRQLSIPLPLTADFTLPSRAIMSPMEGLMSSPLFFKTAAALDLVDFWMPPFLGVSSHAVPSPASLKKKYKLYLDSGKAFCLQILGHDPPSAAKAISHAREIGIKAVNFNFACPSRTVLGSRSGGAVLQDPGLVEKMLLTARKENPEMCISMKMRTGFHDFRESRDILHAANNAGCDFVICHARTVEEKYMPVSKEEIRKRMTFLMEQASSLPVIGNGDIVSKEDAKLFLSCSCTGVAIARGLLKTPFLLKRLKGNDLNTEEEEDDRKLFLALFRSMLSGRQGAGTYAECIKLSYGENSDEFRDAVKFFRERHPERERKLEKN